MINYFDYLQKTAYFAGLYHNATQVNTLENFDGLWKQQVCGLLCNQQEILSRDLCELVDTNNNTTPNSPKPY